MADSAVVSGSVASVPAPTAPARHSALVRITHWVTTLCFFALLITGIEIVISHPRFYWGEAGNVNVSPLIDLHIPSSRATVPTGYGYVLPDQNGWSRALHFQSAWVLVLTGLVYVLSSFVNGHVRKDLTPAAAEMSWGAFSRAIANHLRLKPSNQSDVWSYNLLQRLTYLLVIFVLFPLIIWTGLAMSPAIMSVFPGMVSVLGGQQSARTIHFFVSGLLVLFLLTHVGMICVAGFKSRMRAMITGRIDANNEEDA